MILCELNYGNSVDCVNLQHNIALIKSYEHSSPLKE
jgi:hypothetical protein